MGNEAATRLMMEHRHTTRACAYETIESTAEIRKVVRHLTTTCVEQVAFVTIALAYDNEGKASSGRQGYNDPTASTVYLLSNLRPLVRRTDVVFLLGHTLHFLLLGANMQGGEIVQTRLWDALLWRVHNLSEGEYLRPRSITSGYSAYPVPFRAIDECIEAACDANLHSAFGSEKSLRKPVTRQGRMPQDGVPQDELPVLARKLGIPYLTLLPRKQSERVQQLVCRKLALELRCYPIGRERNILTVAMVNPQDQLALERLHQETGLDIFPVLTHPQELQMALEQLI